MLLLRKMPASYGFGEIFGVLVLAKSDLRFDAEDAAARCHEKRFDVPTIFAVVKLWDFSRRSRAHGQDLRPVVSLVGFSVASGQWGRLALGSIIGPPFRARKCGGIVSGLEGCGSGSSGSFFLVTG